MIFLQVLDAISKNYNLIHVRTTGKKVAIQAAAKLQRGSQEHCVLLMSGKFFPLTEIALDESGLPFLKEEHLGIYFDSRGRELKMAIQEFNQAHGTSTSIVDIKNFPKQ